MQSKSSTSLAMISILAILIVFFIGVSNVEDSPQRKPFPTQGADNPDAVISDQQATQDNEPVSVKPSIEISNSDQIELKVATPPPTPPSASTTELLVKNINSDSLTRAGFTNFVIKPRPFTGKLFDQFDLSMLSYLNIVEKNVTENDGGNEKIVLQAFEFELTDDNQNQEVYDFLKAKIKDELGATVNETNQFGLSSFFINFNEPKDSAFLVVKTRTNVYALSYPKAKSGDKSYFELVSKLLLELI